MTTYIFGTVMVDTHAQADGDTLLEYCLGTYVERYKRRPDKSVEPRWFVQLIGIYMPVRESDVPNEVRQAWVYCYERALPLVENGPHYAA